MELHLIRHGQTDWNEERRVQGQSESRLTELGKQQARELGEKIKQVDYGKVYCSSSLRTRQTADQAFNETGIAIEYLDSLREIHLGPWEGKLYVEVEKSDPESYQHFWQTPHLFNVSGAETFADLQNRALRAVDHITADGNQDRVAIVSHGALIKSLLCHYEQRHLSQLWEPPQMHNCAHSIVKLNANGKGRIVLYADISQN
ncbi:MAG: histidine phosphatase family protein [Gammaproteobacteria bacterium]|jgi:probable phosphoglycerate mutase|nr:histidine phosphatase family protein [Gammaproteobacteria bacterium]|tara:strand:+ start:149 stop:754 length:606 start_codon:yes stop_codon:yes gene_type:complete